MTWHARLQLDYRESTVAADPSTPAQPVERRTTVQFDHDGPLRVLQSLYPEGLAVCHNVLVHPPGGLVGGDVLDVTVHVGPRAHGFVGTPGATRFYATDRDWATQRVSLQLEADARLEWFPLETLAYPGCRARNQLQFELAPGAELMGWDITALGLPGSDQPFHAGVLEQDLRWPGHWRERARLQATDHRLLNSPLGLAGHRCMGTFWLAAGRDRSRDAQDALLASVRSVLPDGLTLAATCPHPSLLLVRALAPMSEPILQAFQAVWRAVRTQAWGMPAPLPRIWGV